jgi:hypothetical protein
VYVSADEFHQICVGLLNLDIKWQVSRGQDAFKEMRELPHVDSMTISVVSAHGTARGNVDPDKLCPTLAPLDSAFSSKHALWEFQSLRNEYYCKIPNFRFDTFNE